MRERISIFLISAALIGFQLAIIQILSYSQWHHFAYLAVSIAMLGFGSSGVILALYPNKFKRLADGIMPWLFTICGLLILVSPILINSNVARFDPFLLFSSNVHIAKFFLTCFILFLPFLIGALVIGLFFMVRSHSIPLLYAWNLAGSALGGALVVVLSYHILPMNLASLFGFCALGAGWLLSRKRLYNISNVIALLLGMLLVALQPQLPYASEFKSLTRTLDMPESRVSWTKPTPQGTFQLVTSQTLRQAQGLSLTYTGAIPLADMAFLNAQAYCAIEKLPVDSSFYQSNLFTLPYLLSHPQDVLVLEPQGTSFISQALWYGALQVDIVEPIKPMADTLKQFPWPNGKVSTHREYSREFLANTEGQWQVIALPTLGTFGGAAGIASMQEQYLFTTKSIALAMQRLSPDGMLVLSSYMDNPPRYSAKAMALVTEYLRGKGLTPTKHIVAYRDWSSMVILVSPEPIAPDKYRIAEDFCSRFSFDMVFPFPESQLNILSDSTFAILTKELLEGNGEQILGHYPFNISPPTDNSPYFSQFLRIANFRDYRNTFGLSQLPFLELGYLVVWVSLIICIILSTLVIAIPLIRSVKRGNLKIPMLFYFASLGLAYMLIEMALIQRSILALGNPITASAVIIGALLCFSAVGSYHAGRFPLKPTIISALSGITILVIVLAFFGNQLSYWLLTLPFAIRVGVLICSVLPLAILMGVAFPSGMNHLSQNYPEQIPIAWGVNGFFSVLAAPLGTILAVEVGYTQVLFLSAILYAFCIPFGILLSIAKKPFKLF